MIFAALVLLSLYLPTRAVLQQATQQAADAIATERGTTWVRFNENTLEYNWLHSRSELPNVYVAVFRTILPNRDDADRARVIVNNVEQNSISLRTGNLTVTYAMTNLIIYQEIHVSATRTFPMPVNLSFIGFPQEIAVTATSTAVVRNGAEFVRNVDIAVEVVSYLSDRFNLDEVFSGVSDFFGRFTNFLGE